MKKQTSSKSRSAPKQPLVTICLPSYNNEKGIPLMLQSIARLNWPRKEVIVVDESKDKTPEVVRKFAKKYPYIKLFHFDNRRGRGFARQFALDHAKGDYAAPLDADSWIRNPNWVQLMLRNFKQLDIGGVFSLRHARNSHSSIARYWALATLAEIETDRKYPKTGTGNTMLKMSAVRKSGAKFDTKLKGAEDIDFFEQMHAAGYWFVYEPEAWLEQDNPEGFWEVIKKRIDYAKWNTIRARLRGRLASYIAKYTLYFLLTPLATLYSFAKALKWYSRSGDAAVFWHVPIQTVMVILYPFIAIRHANTPAG